MLEVLPLLPQGAQPALASMSSEFGDMGVWYRPDRRRARFLKWEKKLSLCPLEGDDSPDWPFKALSASWR